MNKIRIGINGFGRIGRAIFRRNLEKRLFEIVAINEINTDIDNIAYLLNYDTLYDKLPVSYKKSGNSLINGTDHAVRLFHCDAITDPDWQSYGIDYLIDTSGKYDNVLLARNLIVSHIVKKIFITHSPDPVDFTMVLGANEEEFDVNAHHIISTSICDATAIAPTLKVINREFGIEQGAITTLHPWLNYQNLLDGPAVSWSNPGEAYHYYALGRASTGCLIPKPTTAVSATCKVLAAENITEEMIGSLSYRTPTAIVASADITLLLKFDTDSRRIMELFKEIQQRQKWHIFLNNSDPLISSDFKRCDYSAIIDNRWTNVMKNRMLKLVLWYDNEWGYSSRVVDQVIFVARQVELQATGGAKGKNIDHQQVAL